ncbi:D-alanyl-D-alanine carboxypeptidase family protein [Gottfriedia acidiceleris]|uniref:M15 family metallopeptidase n=1 Tax=Gottfriedia acidiceleris TaxID=371036 RepID=UPI0038B3A2F6
MKKIKGKYSWVLIIFIIIIGLALFFRNQHYFNNQKTKETSLKFPNYDDTASEDEDGLLAVKNPTSNLVLVNKERKLPEGYEPPDLVYPIVPLHGVNKDKTLMRKEAAHALEKLFERAESDGIQLTPVSAYRSFDRQRSLYNYYIQIHGADWTQSFSAVPGTSEHQTGLSIDVSSPSFGNKLEQEFGETKEGTWLADHAHEFGFVIRYPEDKVKITEYNYEPWHIRYIGIKYATYLYENDLVLEEVMKPKNN